MTHRIQINVVRSLALALIVCAHVAFVRAADVPKWAVHEITLTASGNHKNPYTETSVSATFKGPGNATKTVYGFWNGGQTFVIRFTPTQLGRWTYTTSSADAGLNNKTGAINCVAPRAGSHGFVRRDAEHPYHFVWDDGARYFMFGTTYYGLLERALKGGDWKAPIDGSLGVGLNKVRFYLPRPGNDDGSGTNVYAGDSSNKDQLNLAHWQKMDEVIEYMNARGMVAEPMPFSNDKQRTGRMFGTQEQDERYLRYFVARYAAYPNVIWCLINEWNYSVKPIAYWNTLGALLKREDPWLSEGQSLRPLSIHQQTRIDFQFFKESWPTHAITQYGVRNGQRTQEDEWKKEPNKTKYQHGDEWGNVSIVYNLGHDMPVVNDEYGYMGEPKDRTAGDVPLTRAKHRQIIWGIYTAGGYGSAGDKYEYKDGGKPYVTAVWKSEPAEYGDIKRLVEFFTTKGIKYWRMKSQNDLVTAGQRVYVLAEAGKQYVAYAAAGGQFSVRLAPGSYTAKRYDPRTGEEVKIGDVKGGGAQSFTVPEGEDWVVYLMAAEQTAGERVVFDVDLTKGEAAVKAARGSVTGGAWEGGWRVTAHGQRIILDAGRPLPNGLLEVWFTKKGEVINADGVKGQWVSLHELDGKLTAEYVQLRAGQKGYGFSKLRAKSNEQAMSTKLKKVTHKRCEVKAGELGDWATDDKTVMRTTIRWQDGLISFTTPNGQPTACTNYFQFPPPYVINALRYVYLGSDESEEGGSLPGLRFKRVRLVELGGKTAIAK